MLTKNSIIFFTWKQYDKRAKKTRKVNRLGDTLAWMETLCLLPLSVNSPLACVAGGMRERASGGGAANFPRGRSP